jgi:SAM-dependent methyltransferase
MTSFAEQIERWGGRADRFLSFSVPDPRLLPFTTLLDRGQLDLVEGVYLWQGSPLIYVLDGERAATRPDDLVRIRRLLAMRADAGYMGLVSHGQLRVYQLGLDSIPIEHSEVDVATPPQLALPYLGLSRPVVRGGRSDSVTKVVIGLLDESISVLIRQNVSKADAISLVGRALFTRFLADRKLLPAGMRENSETLFDTTTSVGSTCKWLDDTFNGDLLPIDHDTIMALTSTGLRVLGDIMRRAKGGQLRIEWHEAWANLDFSQIPVGVLSQAYESFMQSYGGDQQSNEGGYYTPGPIAEMMVRGAFAGVGKTGGADKARILDPACGAGIFLIVAFRELVAEYWRAYGHRPDTKTLRKILYGQITGFDINDAALRFAALALYLISIELDPEPEPIEKLRFDDLRGRVLFHVGDHPDKLGSMGNAVGPEHDAAFDLVVGNPPWPTGSKQKNWPLIQARVNRICRDRWSDVDQEARVPESDTRDDRSRENVNLQGQLPDFVVSGPAMPKRPMDLPFVWRAMEWAKPGAQIAFALHGRLLFQQNEMRQGREALFRSLSVRTVINGAELRQTDLWPNVDPPFLVLFATNIRPRPTDAFKFITPHYEPALNNAGLMRVDLDSAVTVPIAQLVSSPSVLKVLARGSSADLGIVERIRKRDLIPLVSYWGDADQSDADQDVPARSFRLGLTGYGYQALRPSSEVTENKPEPGFSASYLHGLPMLRSRDFGSLLVDTSQLPPFAEERCHRAKPRELFEGPILLVRKTPPTERGRIEVGICATDVVFAETLYGYGAGKNPDSGILLRYLALLIGSRPIFWLALMMSGEYGVERDVVEKGIIDNLLVPPFETMPPHEIQRAMALFDLCAADAAAWAKVDEWVAGLLGLSARDIQTIEDTLDFGLPTSASKIRGVQPASKQDIEMFGESIEAELAPWQQRFGSELRVTPIPVDPMAPWAYLFVGPRHMVEEFPKSEIDKLTMVADAEAAGEIIVETMSGLLVAKIRQRRAWTLTKSRLLAQRLVWDHLQVLKGPRQ